MIDSGLLKIVNEKPPQWIFDECMRSFRINPLTVVWTYGDTLYNPGAKEIPGHLMAHEMVHKGQQAFEGPEKWWRRYLTEPDFRLKQEVAAYAQQYLFYTDTVKDRNWRVKFLNLLAGSLASPMYKLSVTRQQAKDMIEVSAGFKTIKQ